uniref:Ig-like domain-containing protein n=1 Tax=Sphaeramia orbicularis TaxID=375764 RepID=A0A673A7V9_9TELE
MAVPIRCLLFICLFSVQLVEVDSREESVLLPWKTIAHLTKNSRQISVMWKNLHNQQILVHKYGSGEPDEQDQDYRNRTEMKKHWLRTGDFSLTLKNPMDRDTNEYLCTIYNKDKVLKEKRVVLEVRGQCCRQKMRKLKVSELSDRNVHSQWSGRTMMTGRSMCMRTALTELMNRTINTETEQR